MVGFFLSMLVKFLTINAGTKIVKKLTKKNAGAEIVKNLTKKF